MYSQGIFKVLISFAHDTNLSLNLVIGSNTQMKGHRPVQCVNVSARGSLTSKGSFSLELPVLRLYWKMRGLSLQLSSGVGLPKTAAAVSLAAQAKPMLTFCCSSGSSQPIATSALNTVERVKNAVYVEWGLETEGGMLRRSMHIAMPQKQCLSTERHAARRGLQDYDVGYMMVGS